MRLGIPAVTMGGGGEGGNWHSRNEWYKPVDAYYGPQNALLTILMLTGLDGVTKPALQVETVINALPKGPSQAPESFPGRAQAYPKSFRKAVTLKFRRSTLTQCDTLLHAGYPEPSR
jgi:hypothetical protein